MKLLRRAGCERRTNDAASIEAERWVRLERYIAGLLYGAQNVCWRLEDLGVTPLPSLRTIDRILVREGLTPPTGQ